jgi:hypothetical protein
MYTLKLYFPFSICKIKKKIYAGEGIRTLGLLRDRISHRTLLDDVSDLKSCAVGQAWLPLQMILTVKSNTKCGRRDSNPGRGLGRP